MSGARILIVKTSSMGDIVHALPLASDLAARLPQARIDWLVEESFAAIPRLHPAVARVIPVALRRWRRHLLSAATWSEVRAARRQLNEFAYDRIIDCQGLLKSAWLARWARGPRTGPDRRSAREPLAAAFYQQAVSLARDLHAIERNRRLGAAAFGYAIETAPAFGLRLPPAPPPVAGGAPYAVLLSNASRASKLWPDERWRAVESWLAARGLRSLLLSGTRDEAQATGRRAAGMRAAQSVPRMSLEAAASVLAGARVVVGLDTGLTHLAAALGAPTVAIYCDYDPALVGVVGAAPCASLGGVGQSPAAEAVIEAAARVVRA